MNFPSESAYGVPDSGDNKTEGTVEVPYLVLEALFGAILDIFILFSFQFRLFF